MAHTAQERYSNMVDEKLRQTLVTVDNYIFNNKYEGNPKAGVVKIPVRDTEVKVKDYNKKTGTPLEEGATAYINLTLDKDKSVNELIDGYDAAAVPDNVVADRIDSAGYSLGLTIDSDSIAVLERTENIKISTVVAAATKATAYTELLTAKTYLSRTGVPLTGRWAIISPEFHALLMLDTNFIKQSDLSQELVMIGAVGQSAGFTLFESNNLLFEEDKINSSKKTTTEFIAGHSNWCHRVMEWQVPVHLQDLAGSGTYIGASAVQGRKIYGLKVSKPKTVYTKRTVV